jgi:hypothetical protein
LYVWRSLLQLLVLRHQWRPNSDREISFQQITIDGLKTYVTGPASADKAILLIYDIFGFFPQTLQGADILASGDKENQYQVFIPGEPRSADHHWSHQQLNRYADFFDGPAADISWYPPQNKEHEAKLGEFFSVSHISASIREYHFTDHTTDQSSTAKDRRAHPQGPERDPVTTQLHQDLGCPRLLLGW